MRDYVCAIVRWPSPALRLSLLGPRRLAAWIFAAIGILAAAGAWVILAGRTGSIWDLDREWTVPAAFSALLLAGAALCAGAVGRRRLYGIHRSAYLLAGLFFVMGLDEAFQIHERLESATGVDWQTLYAPVILVCGVAWFVVVRSLREFRGAQATMALGGLAWLVAQVFEKIQWHGEEKIAAYNVLMFFEEVLEMTGSGLFLLALYWVLWQATGRRDSPA